VLMITCSCAAPEGAFIFVAYGIAKAMPRYEPTLMQTFC
jgi:hypothetical protein